MKTVEERFWEKVNKTDSCWLWTAAIYSKRKPYGVFQQGQGRGTIKAHVWSYTQAKGDTNDLCVLHTCDNPRCVNPDHLFLGTRADNNKDMENKGRAWYQNKTHCRQGHEWIPENIFTATNGNKCCRICKAIRRRRIYLERGH